MAEHHAAGTDAIIRAHGWRIYSRPARGQALWLMRIGNFVRCWDEARVLANIREWQQRARKRERQG